MKNAGKACNNRLYRHIRTFEKIVKNYFVIYNKCKQYIWMNLRWNMFWDFVSLLIRVNFA